MSMLASCNKTNNNNNDNNNADDKNYNSNNQALCDLWRPRSKYLSWHLEHMVKDFPGCVKSSHQGRGRLLPARVPAAEQVRPTFPGFLGSECPAVRPVRDRALPFTVLPQRPCSVACGSVTLWEWRTPSCVVEVLGALLVTF